MSIREMKEGLYQTLQRFPKKRVSALYSRNMIDAELYLSARYREFAGVPEWRLRRHK
jgi:hypothetical protein